MKRNQSSLTAAGIAIVRAIESEKPAGERICYDPFARRFVGAGLFYFVKFFVVLGYANWKGPGVWEFLAARERYIDDTLQTCLGDGLEQLVIRTVLEDRTLQAELPGYREYAQEVRYRLVPGIW